MKLNNIFKYKHTSNLNMYSSLNNKKMTQISGLGEQDLLRLALYNSYNKTGTLNYNKYGRKDNAGFIPCDEEKFVDSFVVYIIVPDYLVKKRKTKLEYTDLGSTQKLIKRVMLEHGMYMKFTIKGVGLTKLMKKPKEDAVTGKLESMENRNTQYYRQNVKIAAQEFQYDQIMRFLRQDLFKDYKIFLKDIDVTIDYTGSFQKEEVVAHLLKQDKFRLEGSKRYADCTILFNERSVGMNCLTWMETVDGIEVRSKIYNKFVQMIESESVRRNIGNHWKAWVDQFNTRLADARDCGRYRGLTRAEITVTCMDSIPSDHFIHERIMFIQACIPNSLVYSTPYDETWRAYCENLKHSLVIIDKTTPKERGVIIYSVNELTGKACGKVVAKDWRKKEDWCLAFLTLSEALPLDIITVENMVHKPGNREKYRVKMNSYLKENTKGEHFKTRLVRKSVYEKSQNSSGGTLEEDAGLIPIDGYCIPFLARTKAGKNSAVPLRLHHVEELEARGIPLFAGKMRRTKKQRERASRKVGDIRENENIVTALKSVLEKQRLRKKAGEMYAAYAKEKVVKLSSLDVGTYVVTALRPVKRKYGERYVMLLDVGGAYMPCSSNWDIEQYINRLLSKSKRSELQQNNMIYLDGQTIGMLNIRGKKRLYSGMFTTDCFFTFSKAFKDTTRTQDDTDMNEKESEAQVDANLPAIPEYKVADYKSLPNLCGLPINSYHTVQAKISVLYYRVMRLVVQLEDNKLYQAGESLQQQEHLLKQGTRFYIVKYKNGTDRKRMAVCQVLGKDNSQDQNEKEDSNELQKRKIENELSETIRERAKRIKLS